MSLQGIEPKQKFPGAIVADLRDYVAALGLPSDWPMRIKSRSNIGGTGCKWWFDYEGEPMATYECDILQEIVTKTHHMPIPSPVDPLVVASQLAVIQPSDPEWRRFKHLTFRREEVMYVNNVDEKGKANGNAFTIVFRNGESVVCGNESNYANSGMSTCDFFLEHVMNLTPENANRSSISRE